jgi:hypothetical protein
MFRTQVYIFHTEKYIGYTTTCFGPVYWPSSGCTVNLTSSYTTRACGTVGGTRSRLTVVGGMTSVSPWTGVNIIRQ